VIDSQKQHSAISKIIGEARKKGVVVKFESKDKMDKISDSKNHQGVIAYVAAYDYVEVEDILSYAREKDEQPFILILDGIEDPHNLGAIIRTANIVGIHGIIIPKRRAVGLTATVAKTSAGAIEYAKIARVTNITRTIEDLKKEGLWIAGADMDGEIMYKVDLKGPLAIVVGGEGQGVSKLVKEKCDLVARIPMKGDISSLNASVATGVIAFEAFRQREFSSKV
jgi:23S rRNA (guanosine2251-2'-O)-methyltransferase